MQDSNTVKRKTVQKELIKKIVLDSCDHPTAEMIYQMARVHIENISIGTVYRVLQELVASGDVRGIDVPQSKMRFDKTTCVHAHFLCRNCDAVTDVAIDASFVLDQAVSVSEHYIDGAEIVLKGVCSKCCNI